MHIDVPSLKNISEKDIFLTIQAADAFVKNDHKPTSISCPRKRILLRRKSSS